MAAPAHGAIPTVRAVTAADLDGLGLAPRVVAPFDPADAQALLRAAALDGARVVAAVSGSTIVGVAVAAPSATEPAVESLLALGVAPAFRGAGLGAALLRALVDGRPPRTPMEARVGVAERDVVEPADVETRLEIARRAPRRGRLRDPPDTAGPGPGRPVDAGREAAGRLIRSSVCRRSGAAWAGTGRWREGSVGPPSSSILGRNGTGTGPQPSPTVPVSAPTSTAWNSPPPTARSTRYHERRARKSPPFGCPAAGTAARTSVRNRRRGLYSRVPWPRAARIRSHPSGPP